MKPSKNDFFVAPKIFNFRGKSQIISMDFIMTFVVYLFALSVFFFSLRNVLSSNDAGLDVSGELLFNRIDQIYDNEYDFLDNSKLDITKFDTFFSLDNKQVYDYLFKDFENPAFFTRIDYCVYLVDKTDNSIFRNYNVNNQDDYPILLVDKFNSGAGAFPCGTNPPLPYPSHRPDCPGKAESIVLTKPVLHNNAIIDLKVFICAEKR